MIVIVMSTKRVAAAAADAPGDDEGRGGLVGQEGCRQEHPGKRRRARRRSWIRHRTEE